MPKRYELDEITPSYLWNDLHIKGRTVDASDLSEQVLASIRTQGGTSERFTDMNVAERHGEIAAITMVTSLAAFQRAPAWPAAEEFLVRATQTAAHHYPLGHDTEEASLRGDYWDPVYGEESAQRIAAGHLVKLYDILSALTHNVELQALSTGLKTFLCEGSSDNQDQARFDLIHTIGKNSSQYTLVRAAYQEFMKRFGFESSVESLDQIVTVTSKVLGKAFAEKDMKTVLWCLTTMKIALQKQPNLWKFIAKEIAKNFDPKIKERLSKNKLDEWSDLARSSEELLALITQLEGMVFLGLGHGAAIALQ